MLWSEVKPEELRAGDKIHVFKGEFNQLEATVEDINGDLYADGVGWFTDNETDDEPDWSKHWDLIHRLNIEPKVPGVYISQESGVVLDLLDDGSWLSYRTSIVTGGWDYIADRWAPIDRVYTQAEVEVLLSKAQKGLE